MNNLLVAQSGGPTCAINATLAGVIEAAMVSGCVDKVYGGVNGVKGILEGRLCELGGVVRNAMDLAALAATPAAALGSCRFKLDGGPGDEACERLLEIFRAYEISYFVYIGGNDSMDTVAKLSAWLEARGIRDITVVGAPKTIDNDLMETDHCPGFGSAAKFIAATCAQLERDLAVYDTFGVTVVEIMGRDAGWLTAAASLASLSGGRGPDLIYLCERPFSVEAFLREVEARSGEKRNLLVAVSEGVRDETGRYLCEWGSEGDGEKRGASGGPGLACGGADSVSGGPGSTSGGPGLPGRDVFGHRAIAGAARVLEAEVKERFGCKTRSVELNLIQRCAADSASRTDLEESRQLGQKAVQCAIQRMNGVMAVIRREGLRPYVTSFSSVPASAVANRVKRVPAQWINEAGNGVTEEMRDYLEPLIQGEVQAKMRGGVPEYFRVV